MSTCAGCLAKQFTAVLCCLLLIPSGAPLVAAQTQTQTQGPAPNAQSQLIPADQLDSLVAPIALYPDQLLAQVLVASTYPLEIVQLQQWLAQHKDLKGQALTDAVMKENWDPSIQAMAVLPDVVKQLADNIKWTSDLGNAFLAQQQDVMDAVQRMRMKAKNAGKLTTTEQQKVETQVVENKTVVVIEPANPQVVYVPSYNPVVVYGPPVYPYPPIYYPPPGYYAAGMAISFGVGLAIGAAWGGGWGWGCGWGGHNNIYINNNNNFVRNSNISNINRGGRASQLPAGGRSNWQHNPQHRGAAPYGDRATANRYGGTARGETLAGRQASARQQIAQRPAQGQPRQQPGQRPSQGQARQQPAGGGRDFSAGSRGGPSGGGDRVGNRQVSRGSSSGAFGGAGNRTSGSAARMSGSRGASSMGGGGRRGGGRRR